MTLYHGGFFQVACFSDSVIGIVAYYSFGVSQEWVASLRRQLRSQAYQVPDYEVEEVEENDHEVAQCERWSK